MPPKDEIARRLQAIRERMSSRGLDLLLMFNQLIWVTTELQELLRSVGLDWVVELG